MDEFTNAQKIQAVINTLEQMDIPSTFANCNRLLGIYQTLAAVRDDLNNNREDAEEVKEDGGEADAE